MTFDDEFSDALVVGGNRDVTVYEATDTADVAVVVAVMTPVAASLRPQQREAFVVAAGDAVRAATAGDPVFSADVTADRPWVAVTSPPGLPALRDILATVGTTPEKLVPRKAAGAAEEPSSQVEEAPEEPFSEVEEAAEPDGAAAPPAVTRSQDPLPGMPRRPVAVVWSVVAVAAVLAVVAVTALHLLWQPETETTVAGARPTAVPSLATDPFVSPSPIPSPPALKRVPPVRLVGPVFGANDTTQLVHPRELPFAFRVPASWDCGRGRILPGGVGYSCDAAAKSGVARVTLFVRRCRAVCTPAEYDRFGQDWMDAPLRYRERDATTRLVDVSGFGYYRLAVSHLFRDAARKLTWHVGVYARATPANTAVVQKVVNDIRSQTP